jgi:hypothetical protein
MKDHAIVTIALNQVAMIVGDHFEPGLPRDPVATVKRMIEVLDSQELAEAIMRLEKGAWLRVVK